VAVCNLRRASAGPPPLVLSGHAASLTPYSSDTPRPSPAQGAAAEARGRRTDQAEGIGWEHPLVARLGQ